MGARLDRWTLVSGVVALASIGWTAAVADSAETALVVPTLFVIAGLFGPVWSAARFTCRALVAAGGLHLVAIGCSAVAQRIEVGSAWWHVLSQVLFVAGFAVFVVLAASYPEGPAPRWTSLVAAVACVVPVAAGFAGPTSPVLAGPGPAKTLGPIAAVLPPLIAEVSGVVLTLPLLAVGVAIVRAARGGKLVRGRLSLPLLALLSMAVLLLLGAVVPAQLAGLSTVLFLVGAPLVPVGLILGSIPVTTPSRPDLATVGSSERLDLLSPRERDVLARMAEGMSNAAIGRALHISLSAVEKHSAAIFAKLDLTPERETHRRVTAAVMYLRSAGLLPADDEKSPDGRSIRWS